jgi:plasmid stability protein
MPTLIVRNVDDETKERLTLRAAENGRSTEAEIRAILKDATSEKNWVTEWFECVEKISGTDFELPDRSIPRRLDLFGSE